MNLLDNLLVCFDSFEKMYERETTFFPIQTIVLLNIIILRKRVNSIDIAINEIIDSGIWHEKAIQR